MSALIAAVGPGVSPAARLWVEDALGRSGASGQDGTGIWSGGGCVLGQATLRVTGNEDTRPVRLPPGGDLGAGEEIQAGRGLVIAGEARLDDRAQLVRELRSGGCMVEASKPDLVLVAHAYHLWGDACLGHMRGDFAFAVWDEVRHRLWCARDQLGAIPLHYATVGVELLVATSVAAMRLHPGVPDDLDEEAVADFLLIGWTLDAARTTFRAIKRLPPAHCLTWSEGALAVRRYWQLPVRLPLARFPRNEDYATHFRDLLDQAVADRLPTGPVAVQLSGGMDSTSVAASAKAVLARNGGGQLRAVTVTLGEASGDREGEYAALVAGALGVELDQIDASMYPAIDPWAAPPLAVPEPIAYRPTAQQWEFGRIPSEYARVGLTGIGGDCLVWSSPWYWAEWLAHGQLGRLSAALRHELAASPGLPHLGLRTAARHFASMPSPRKLPSWLAPDFAARTGAQARLTSRRPARLRDTRSLVEDPLWPAWSMWGHPTFSGLPIQFRHPLLDLRLIEYALALPPHPWLVDKRVMRQAGQDRLPEVVLTRPKTPLARAADPNLGPAVLSRLAAFIKEVPGLERFVDPAALATDLTGEGTSQPGVRMLELGRPLGLAYWLQHAWRPATG